MHKIHRDCSVCGADRLEEVTIQPIGAIAGIGDIDYQHHIVICKDCGLVFASPILDEATYNAYYTSFSNYENPQSGGVNSNEDKAKFERMYAFIAERFEPGFKGRVLDIGCSVAYGLYLFKQQGWDVVGLDPSERCKDLSKQLYDVDVITGLFSNDVLEQESGFDVVILSHVLEHLVAPESIVLQLRKLLTPNGKIYIEVPNLLQPFVPMGYFTFEHLNYFTPRTLTGLMARCGFSPDHVATFDNSAGIHPFYPVIASTWGLSATAAPAPISDYSAGRAAVASCCAQSASTVKRLSEKIEQIIQATPPGRLALWGGGIHTSQLLSLTALSRAKIAHIYDNDPKKIGNNIANIPIVGFSGDAELERQAIDAIIISSCASEQYIYRQISFLEKSGIRVHRLYSA